MNNRLEQPSAPLLDSDALLLAGRERELQMLHNALIAHKSITITSPIGYGKAALAIRAARVADRPTVLLRMPFITSLAGLAGAILQALLDLEPWERIQPEIQAFRERVCISWQPEETGRETRYCASFPNSTQGIEPLEDVLALAGRLFARAKTLVIVWEEFQEIAKLMPEAVSTTETAGRVAAALSGLKLVDNFFLGSNEPQIRALFETPDSAFKGLAPVMSIARPPEEPFAAFLLETLKEIRGEKAEDDVRSILAIAQRNPVCTQDLTKCFLAHCKLHGDKASVEAAADDLVHLRHAAYSTLWKMFGRLPRRILQALAQGEALQTIRELSTSTVYSAAGKLKAEGTLFRDDAYRITDPLFARWIRQETAKASFGFKADLELPPEA